MTVVTMTLIKTATPRNRFILAGKNSLSDLSPIAKNIQDGKMNEVIEPT